MLSIDTVYLSICLSLNLLLTLMIVIRLILHNRNVRQAMGTSGKTTGLYTTVVTMLVESYALYAIALLSYIVPYTQGSWVVTISSQIVGGVQVRAVLA